ncbi:Armadillo [Macleaya cordata]|uniref:RING-type E3 ubiquitin transferase n=1 Tax=Macleaya cordata TaxID=56857 RepID=A0A200PW03_MACCD|nr:Armadillo [Macleaya cordata]
MDKKSLRCLINSISRFIHLVACHTVESAIIEKDYVNMVGILKLLKPVLDEVIDSAVHLDEKLVKELEELDIVVNEAREFMEKWCPKMSKIYSVLHSEPLALKVQSSALEIINILYRFFLSAPLTSHLSAIQKNIQEFQYPEQDRISEVIEEALGDERENLVPCAEHLIRIMKSLSLTSSQELLTESVVLEKARVKAQALKKKDESDLINQIIDLISLIRDCTVELELFDAPKGPPVPPYFQCPLSLELMLDPVIVASGQTYEKVFIQKWLDHGLIICPKTRQTLTHTNLIPNYTVKALIANWCDDNNIRFPNTIKGSSNSPSLSSHSQDFNRANNFSGSLRSSTSSSRSFHGVQSESEKQRVEVSSGLSSRHSSVTESSIEVASEFPASSPLNKDSTFSPSPSKEKIPSSESRVPLTENGNSNHHRSLSLPFTDFGSDDLTSSSHVKKLVEDLRSQSNEAQTAAAAELRLLAKHNKGNRVVIAQCEAIAPLVSLLYSMVKLTQEHAVTALLNLSINDENKVMIAEAGALEPLILILKSGSEGAKENSAATLFSLSVLEQYKIKIGRSGAVKALVDLLSSGTLRGKKDAATALFNLSIFHENKARIVQAGAVKYLIKLMDPDSGMADKAIALLANLAMISEGRSEITREGGIPLLVEVIEVGSQRGKENAASIILQLCISSHKFCSLVLQEGAVPPLVALSQSGTPRAKEKAQQILSHFRDRREGANGKAKS